MNIYLVITEVTTRLGKNTGVMTGEMDDVRVFHNEMEADRWAYCRNKEVKGTYRYTVIEREVE